MFNTHSRYGDCRAEIFASHAAVCGASREAAERIMDSAMTDDMLAVLDEEGLRSAVMDSLTKRIGTQIEGRHLGSMKAGAVIFSNVYGILGMTGNAPGILGMIKKEYI
jgi:cobalt-precorrin-5B (C1)-methyltransferase